MIFISFQASKFKTVNFRLPYLNATIAEILRHANVSSTTIAHRALDDGAVLGHDIKKNWSIIGDLRSVHMDPEHWNEPEKFQPERFLNSNGDYVEDPWLMPFGSGEFESKLKMEF